MVTFVYSTLLSVTSNPFLLLFRSVTFIRNVVNHDDRKITPWKKSVPFLKSILELSCKECVNYQLFGVSAKTITDE